MSMTLTSELLLENYKRSNEWVERLFGNTDSRVEIVKIIFENITAPYTAYPSPYSQFLIEIHLPDRKEDWEIRKNLTHELVHCLMPNGQPSHQATFFEEGLAEHSSIYYMDDNYSMIRENGEVEHDFWRRSSTGKYKIAFDLIEKIVEFEGLEEMREAVRNMRLDTGLPFSQITAGHMSIYFPDTPMQFLKELEKRFH